MKVTVAHDDELEREAQELTNVTERRWAIRESKIPKNIPPRLKPHSFHRIFTGVKTPVSLRIKFFRSL
jgi:hypothetical protein